MQRTNTLVAGAVLLMTLHTGAQQPRAGGGQGAAMKAASKGLTFAGLTFYGVIQLLFNLAGHCNVEIFPRGFPESALGRTLQTPTFHALHHPCRRSASIPHLIDSGFHYSIELDVLPGPKDPKSPPAQVTAGYRRASRSSMGSVRGVRQVKFRHT